MSTKPDMYDDVRHALRAVGMVMLAVAALCIVRVVHSAMAGDWITAAFNALVVVVFGSGWISTEIRADRYRTRARRRKLKSALPSRHQATKPTEYEETQP